MVSLKNTHSRRSFINKSSTSIASALMGLPVTGALEYTHEKNKNKLIPTLTGEIAPDKLGTTLMHEHVLWFSGPRLEDTGYTPIPDDLQSDTVDFAVSLLNDAARVGIDTVVDLTPFRPLNLYKRIAEQTTVKIVPSTGFYRRAKIPGQWANMEDEKQMEELMLKEVTEGIDGTKIRAGIIKVAGEAASLSDWEKKVFRAAARVQKATGTPIATHTGGALEQFNLLVKTGADPHRIFLSHVDVGRKGKPGELISIAKEGGYLEVDTFGQNFYTPWSDLVSFLRSFCDAGLANRIFISIDSNWHWEKRKKIFEGAGAPNFDPNAANRTFAYMITDAVPSLLKSGFSTKEINTFLVDNPRNFFQIKT
jgi:phosphotriesterase-related protein